MFIQIVLTQIVNQTVFIVVNPTIVTKLQKREFRILTPNFVFLEEKNSIEKIVFLTD